jgi:hypothetical protein
LLRRLPGQAGLQRFFSERERAFCLYVVIGAHARRDALVRMASRALEQLRI